MDKTTDKYWTFCICLILALTTFAAYWQVHSYDFVDYDDRLYVSENTNVTAGLTRQGIAWAFTTGYFGNWHPLTWLSHMLDCELFGLNAGRHHLTNLLLHIANTLLLFIVLKRATGVFWQSAFVAAAFALHPLHVESVAWISERKDVLSTLFWMLTMAAYLRYVRQPRISWYLLTLLAFALGLMAKPMVVTLPFVLLLLDYWPLGRFQNGQTANDAEQPDHKFPDSRFQWPRFYRLVLEKVPFFALSVVSSIVTFFVQQAGEMVAEFGELPLMPRIANAVISYAKYLEKMIWPSRLAVFYTHSSYDAISVWKVAAAVLILLAISICVFRLARSHKYLTVGWLWYLGTLLPVIGLVQVGGQALADRYSYMPFTGLFIIIAWEMPKIIAKWKYKKFLLTAVAAVVVPAMMICSWLQVRNWKNTYSLFSHSLAATNNDNFTVHYMLGKELFNQEKFGEAIHHFNETLRLQPQHFNTLNKLGAAYYRIGKINQALIYWEKALKLKPDHADVHYNLGVALFQQSKLNEAVRHFNQAIRLRPELLEVHKALANALFLQGKLDEAVRKYRWLIGIQPQNPGLYNRLALVLIEQGKFNQAVTYFEQALRLQPNSIEFMNNLAWIMATNQNPDFRNPQKAIRLAERACKLSNYQMHGLLDTLSAAYAAAARFADAVDTAEKALKLAQAEKQEKLVADIQKRLTLYKAGKPYYEK
ncbi:MAG: tetratricopeptide repeat protein [Planctomycetota bacterium]